MKMTARPCAEEPLSFSEVPRHSKRVKNPVDFIFVLNDGWVVVIACFSEGGGVDNGNPVLKVIIRAG